MRCKVLEVMDRDGPKIKLPPKAIIIRPNTLDLNQQTKLLSSTVDSTAQQILANDRFLYLATFQGHH